MAIAARPRRTRAQVQETTEAAPTPERTKIMIPPRRERTKVIPIKAAPEPAQEAEEGEEGGKRTDYAEVVKRYADKVTNRKSAIRAFCVQCSCGALSEVKNCGVVKCPLWPYRLGLDPNNAKTIARLAKENPENNEGEEE